MNNERRHRIVLTALATLGLACLVLLRVADNDPPVAHPAAGAPAAATASNPASDDPVPFVRREAAPRGCYDLQPGERLVIGVRLDMRASVSQGENAPQQLRAAITGDLELRVLARREGELALLATMAEPVVEGGEGTTDAAVRGLSDQLANGTVVRLSQRGSILGYRFPATMCAAHRNQFRTLFAALRATIGAPAESSWNSLDADATGNAEVAGEWDSARLIVTVRKDEYRAGASPVVPDVDGRGTATLEPMAAWWRLVDYAETSTLHISEAGLLIRADATMHAELRTAEELPQAGLAAFDWDAAWAPASGAGDHDAAAGDLETLTLAEEMRGATIGAEIARLRDLLAAAASDVDLYEARRRLVWLLRNDPRALGELEFLLADTNLPQQLVAEVISAVGAADRPATHGFLLARLTGTNSPAMRVMTMQALFQGSGDVGATVQALRGNFAEVGAPPALHGTGLLLLGALASRDGGGAALQELLGRQPFARERGLAVDWLEALGNSGRPEVIDAALPSFGAAEAQERAAAIAAVRGVDDARVRAALASAAERDEAPAVRARAVESLAGRSGDELMPLFERILASEANDTVRAAAVIGVGSRSDRAAAELLLARVARQDASARVRQLALDLLQQRRG